MKKYDVVIIGFGKAGKTLAGFLAGRGKKVALIEKSREMYGGTCINVGCIPSKSLVTWAQRGEAKSFSTFEEKAEYFKQAMDRKNTLITTLRGKNFKKLDDLANVDVINGFGKFVSKNQVKVVGDDFEEVLEADKIVINTGSSSRKIALEGAEGNGRVLFSDDILSLSELPKSLVIVGGGYIGLEFASMFSSFGSEVTVLEYSDVFLSREDSDVSEEIKKTLEAKGVKVVTSAKVSRVEDDKVYYMLDGKEEVSVGEKILLATGRVPNTAGLDLENAGVETLDNGAVKVDNLLRTSTEGIWAVGDVKGGPLFTYVSLDDFRIIRDQLLEVENGKVVDDRIIPYSVFIDPPFSRVGLSEKEAKDGGYDYQVVKMMTNTIPKANVLQRTTGFIKAIVDNKTEKILGVALYCEESHEMINIVKTVMDLGGSYKVLRDQIFTHPTMSEALNDLFSMVK